jgi:hypothetical protein
MKNHFKPGQIINEYCVWKTDRLFSSYLILAEGGYQNMHWQCLCIYNDCPDIREKPGETRFIKKDWLADQSSAQRKNWPSFWIVESAV